MASCSASRRRRCRRSTCASIQCGLNQLGLAAMARGDCVRCRRRRSAWRRAWRVVPGVEGLLGGLGGGSAAVPAFARWLACGERDSASSGRTRGWRANTRGRRWRRGGAAAIAVEGGRGGRRSPAVRARRAMSREWCGESETRSEVEKASRHGRTRRPRAGCDSDGRIASAMVVKKITAVGMVKTVNCWLDDAGGQSAPASPVRECATAVQTCRRRRRPTSTQAGRGCLAPPARPEKCCAAIRGRNRDRRGPARRIRSAGIGAVTFRVRGRPAGGARPMREAVAPEQRARAAPGIFRRTSARGCAGAGPGGEK